VLACLNVASRGRARSTRGRGDWPADLRFVVLLANYDYWKMAFEQKTNMVSRLPVNLFSAFCSNGPFLIGRQVLGRRSLKLRACRAGASHTKEQATPIVMEGNNAALYPSQQHAKR